MHSLILSGGGIDSALCMHLAAENSITSRCLHVDYGQPSAEHEWGAVQRLASKYRHSSFRIRFAGARRHTPGRYLGRNATLINLALLELLPIESQIWIGIHAGTNFYDCSGRFFELSSSLVAEESDGKVRLIAPLLELSKREIVDHSRRIGLPINQTYSCQMGQIPPCGKCLSCIDRGVLGC